MMNSPLNKLVLLIFWVSSAALAQTDTGGGIGGTGVVQIRTENLLDPAGISVQSETKCDESNSLGIAEVYIRKENKIKEKMTVCANQEIAAKNNEFIIIQFHDGIKIRLNENNKITVGRRN